MLVRGADSEGGAANGGGTRAKGGGALGAILCRKERQWMLLFLRVSVGVKSAFPRAGESPVPAAAGRVKER